MNKIALGSFLLAIPLSSMAQDFNCSMADREFPENSIVIAAGAYGGYETKYQIDSSGHQATKIDILVNRPEAPVILMLGAYEPTIWDISKSKDTIIAGVLLSGYHEQKIMGIVNSMPVLNSSRDKKCSSYFYVDQKHINTLKSLAIDNFGKELSEVHIVKNGVAIIGDPIKSQDVVHDESETIESLIGDAPLAGKVGLDDAVEKGIIRKMSYEELTLIKNNAAKKLVDSSGVKIVGEEPLPPEYFQYVHNPYMVLKPFVIPAGLYGANSATFFIHNDVSVPTGNPGHSRIINIDEDRCIKGCL